MKICSICNLEKDEVDFYKRKSSKDGLPLCSKVNRDIKKDKLNY